MKITADTNVLVRAVTGDDPRQAKVAQDRLAAAEMVALPLPALCELAWVLRRRYRIAPVDVGEAIRRLIASVNVSVDHKAAEAGLAMLDAGGDFADGVIAYQGRWLGADVFLSFDRDAVRLIAAAGSAALLLA